MPAQRNTRIHGSTLVYIVVAMSALCAFVSLGVDLGRVQLVKTEVRRAADAAARYAAAGLKEGESLSATRQRAITSAAENMADGTPIVLQNSDVQIGNWGGSPAAFTAGATPYNAVRVTVPRTEARGSAVPLMFAQIIGRTSCDVSASAIAFANTGSGTGFIGLSNFDTGNGATIASYDPANGAPGGANVFSNASIASNTRVHLGGNCSVQGVASIGPTGSISTGNNTTITGGEVRLTTNMTFPATESPTVGSSGAINLSNGQTTTLGAGTFNYDQITTGGNCTINFTGPATVYVTGSLHMGNGCEFQAYNNDPANLELRLVGSGTLHWGGNATVIAQVYAPQGTFRTGNGADVYGSVVANVLDVGGNPSMYYDQTLGGAVGAGGAISLVD